MTFIRASFAVAALAASTNVSAVRVRVTVDDAQKITALKASIQQTEAKLKETPDESKAAIGIMKSYEKDIVNMSTERFQVFLPVKELMDITIDDIFQTKSAQEIVEAECLKMKKLIRQLTEAKAGGEADKIAALNLPAEESLECSDVEKELTKQHIRKSFVLHLAKAQKEEQKMQADEQKEADTKKKIQEFLELDDESFKALVDTGKVEEEVTKKLQTDPELTNKSAEALSKKTDEIMGVETPEIVLESELVTLQKREIEVNAQLSKKTAFIAAFNAMELVGKIDDDFKKLTKAIEENLAPASKVSENGPFWKSWKFWVFVLAVGVLICAIALFKSKSDDSTVDESEETLLDEEEGAEDEEE